MAYIKKIVMHGFKSFARKTEIPFDKGINVIIGPNGSGKSNISDAICFALGRLSVKSMRAEKAKNLIFMGSKYEKPAREACVEIVFDNSDKAFNIDKDEISLKRIVRIKGQSIYKINEDTKTRAEIIETLAQAGIDPYGYNLILQGQIQSIVRMHGEERKKIIGEVAGISVYEWRKEKSLKELEKTDSRLKEVSTILRERTAYLNNLEREKSQAQKYNELQLTVKRAKASLLKKKYDEKQKEVSAILKAIEEKSSQRDKKQEKAEKTQEEIDKFSEKINEINLHIRKSAGVEQGKLREQITNLRAELEGLRVRKEGYENRRREVEHRIEEMKKSVPELEKEIQELRKESPLVAKKAQELKKKKEELAELEKEKKKILSKKSEMFSLRERIEDRKRQLARATAESESLVRQIEEISGNLKFSSAKNCEEAISSISGKISEEKEKVKSLREKELENEKAISVSESDIKRNEEIKKKVNEIDLCPLCQSKITEEHIKHVYNDCDDKIGAAAKLLYHSKNELKKLKEERNSSAKNVEELERKRFEAEKELIAHRAIKEKNEAVKKSVDFENTIRKEIDSLESKRKTLGHGSEDFSGIEEKYENKMLEIEEISSRTEEDIDTTLLYKERELEKIKNIVERSRKDLEDIESEIENLGSGIEEKESSLSEKENKEEELNQKFKKMFTDRDATQKTLQESSMKLSEGQNEIRQIEDQINYLKIGKAKIDGESQTIEMDLTEYTGIEILQGSFQNIEERLKKSEQALQTIGSINMRALEVYDQVKGEYDIVKQKADTIEKEKEEIMKIIEEIDKKKRKTFMKTFRAINSLFSQNFAKLSSKGVAYLEIENDSGAQDGESDKEDISNSSVNIVVKMQKGKYFDVSSLSGGEQTLVALSLLFAIQEYKPYHFYILDEIDAALDKRNSERLAALLKQYMKSGQYIIVTHNDAVIIDSDILYGVSMHEGVSKVLSLRVAEEKKD